MVNAVVVLLLGALSFGADTLHAFQLHRGWLIARKQVLLSAADSRRLLLFGDPNICQRQAELIGSELGLHVPLKGERRGDGPWIAPAGPFPRNKASVMASSFPAGVEVAVVLVHDPYHQGLDIEAQGEIVDALSEKIGAEVISVDASGPTDETFQGILSALEILFEEDGDEYDEHNDNSRIMNDMQQNIIDSSSKSEDKALTDSDLFGFMPVFDDEAKARDSATSLLTALNTKERTSFGPLNLSPVLHESLAYRGIISPTPIQHAAAEALYAGSSAILHAETGSGKTLSFLLPLLQKLVDQKGGLGAAKPYSLVVVSPTRELSAQTFRELRALLPGADAQNELEAGQGPLVQLVDEQDTSAGAAPLPAPVVVGTAKQLVELLGPRHKQGSRMGPSGEAKGIQHSSAGFEVGSLVLDEVDRLFALLGKYSTRQEQERASRHPKPALVLLESALQRNPKLQVVACSATVGRRLRREVGRLLAPVTIKDGVPVICPPPVANTATSQSLCGAPLPKGKAAATMTVAELKAALQSRGVKVKSKALKADLVGQLEGMLSEEMQQSAPANQQAGPDGSAGGRGRSVTIPTGIEHVYFPLREPVSLPDKLDALFMALTLDRPKAPIVFLPDGTSVASAVSSLQRACFMQSLSLDAATTGRTNVADLYTSALKGRRDQNADDSKHATPALPILVACESAARGLHLDGIDAVYVLARPKTADEYLHLAGRTGRCGEPGRVVSVVSYTEADALKAWSKQLRFTLERVKGLNLD